MNLLAFHLGYSASEVYKMRGHPNIPAIGAKIYNDPQELMVKVIGNAKNLIKRFSGVLGADHIYLFEGLDSSDSIDINWEFQSKLAISNKNEINNFLKFNDANAALKYLAEPEFIAEFLSRLQFENVGNVGMLFDVAHTWISSTAYGNKQKIDPEKRFDEYVELLSGQIKQIHINRPGGDGREFLTDAHLLLTSDGNDFVSSDIYKCWKKVKKRIDDSAIVTVEVAKPVDLDNILFLSEIEKQIIALEDC